MRINIGRMDNIFTISLIFLLLWIATNLQYKLEAHYPNYTLLQNLTYQDPEKLKAMTPQKYKSIMADLYWIRYIQFYFDNLDKPEDLKKIMDIIAALDPHLPSVYYYTALSFVSGFSKRAAEPDKAVQILDQGIKAEATYWQLYPTKAIILAAYFHDYPRAQHVLIDAIMRPKAPNYLGFTLATLALRTKNYSLLQQVLSWQKKNYPTKKELAWIIPMQQWLESVKERKQLGNLIRLFYNRTEKYPINPWRYPREEISLPGISFLSAKDPAGYPYQLDTKTGEVRLDPFSPITSLDKVNQAMYIPPERIEQLKAMDRLRAQSQLKPAEKKDNHERH